MLTGLASLTHFWTFGAPPKSSQKAIRWENNALLRPQIVLNLAFWPMEEAPDGPNLLDLVQNAPSGWSPQVKCNFDPKYMVFWNFLGFQIFFLLIL